MRLTLRRVAGGLLLGVLLVLAGLGVHRRWRDRDRQRGDEPLVIPPELKENLSVLEGNTVRIRHADTNELAWELAADKIILGKDRRVTIRGLQEGRYYRDGEPTMTLRADELTWNTYTNNIEVHGNIEAVGDNGLFFTTDAVSWRAKERRLVCPDDVRVTLKDMIFTTRRLVLFPDRDDLACPNPVRIALRNTLMTGSGLRANLTKEVIDILGPVDMIARVGEGQHPFEL